MTRRFDLLVIGSGIAGLSYALRMAEHGSIAIITKKHRAESNTNYAQGGVAAVMSAADSYDMHVRDTLSTGLGLSHQEAVEVMVREGPERIKELIAIGAAFTRREGQLDLGREAGHSTNRIVHAADLTGREIERSLLDAVASHANIQVFEDHGAVELITDHHAVVRRAVDRRTIRCWGAYALNSVTGKVETFLAAVVMLSTGGLGQVYVHTTNPPIATGDGVAMAYRAGATIANMEFIQFHPTTLYNSGSPSFLISEAVRGFGAVLTTRRRRRFMEQYDARGSLAPRDIVALRDRHGAEEARRGFRLPGPAAAARRAGEDEISPYLRDVPDASQDRHHGGADPGRPRRPLLLRRSGDRHRWPDLHRGAVRHGRGQHDRRSRREQAGEQFIARSARLFGARRRRHRRTTSASRPDPRPRSANGTTAGPSTRKSGSSSPTTAGRSSQIMWDYVGIVRSTLRLERARRRVELIRNEVETFYKRTRVTESLIELRNLALCATLIIQCAMKRRESTGAALHHRLPRQGRRTTSCSDTVVESTAVVSSRRFVVYFFPDELLHDTDKPRYHCAVFGVFGRPTPRRSPTSGSSRSSTEGRKARAS